MDKDITDLGITINTSTVADVLDAYGIDGVMPYELKPINKTNHSFIGYAYTVEWASVRKQHNIMEPCESTWNQVKEFLIPEITSSCKGRVYVAGAGPLLRDAALAGGLSSSYFQQLGFEGMVLGGAIRDLNELNSLDMPIVASNVVPTDTQGSYKVVSTGKSCVIDNKVIETGDLVVSDQNGTVVIPQDIQDEVMSKVINIDKNENELLQKVLNGGRLPDLIEEYGRI